MKNFVDLSARSMDIGSAAHKPIVRKRNYDDYEVSQWIAAAFHMLDVGRSAVPRDDVYWLSRYEWCLSNAIGHASR